MKWQDRQGSSNIRSGGRGVGRTLGGGGLIIGLLVFLLTGNPFAALNIGFRANQALPGTVKQEPLQLTSDQQELYDFSAVALKDTEDTWQKLFRDYGKSYNDATMIVFQDKVKSGCGIADAGTGPFYCSLDRCVYMDLSFYDMLIKKFGTDDNKFILSYVISHEIGHHVQNELGVMDQVNKVRSKADERKSNELTVRLELMADYLAGVVAHYQDKEGYLESGDIEAAIKAAWSIGDDNIQKRARGYVRPESFTHGTGDQRARWYKKGYEAGNLDYYNTFDYDLYPDTNSL